MKFRLVRYFTLASLFAFLLVVGVLGFVQRNIAIDNMISLEQGNNVNLTKTFANSLWDEFLPFVARAGTLELDDLRADPAQKQLFREVADLMRGLSVVKVKVYDLEGLTVFSTQASQIGEDKSGNDGFLRARDGTNASELTHRDTFSAFEETIEDRDVLSSYVPIVSPTSGRIEGVFEIYSDVTPFLAEIENMTWTVVGVVLGALALLYALLFLIVRHAEIIIRTQARENTRAQLQITQVEKMASLGQMVAGVAHELNTPLAFTRSNVSMLQDFMRELSLPLDCANKLIQQIRDNQGDLLSLRVHLNQKLRERLEALDDELTTEQLQRMLADTLGGLEQMAELVVNLREFTRLDRARIAEFDLNKGIENVIYIARSAMPEKIAIETSYGELPKLQCMPSQMNQIFINLINNAAQSIESGEGTIRIRTSFENDHIKVEVEDDGCGFDEDVRTHMFEPFFTTKATDKGTGLGLSIVNDIVKSHGGFISASSTPGRGSVFTVMLPVEPSVEQPLAA